MSSLRATGWANKGNYLAEALSGAGKHSKSIVQTAAVHGMTDCHLLVQLQQPASMPPAWPLIRFNAGHCLKTPATELLLPIPCPYGSASPISLCPALLTYKPEADNALQMLTARHAPWPACWPSPHRLAYVLQLTPDALPVPARCRRQCPLRRAPAPPAPAPALSAAPE